MIQRRRCSGTTGAPTQRGRVTPHDVLVHAAVALCALLALYLIKSALGVNLVEGYSLGVWGWFQQALLPWLGWR